jgi:hypothetical protein
MEFGGEVRWQRTALKFLNMAERRIRIERLSPSVFSICGNG